MREIVKLARRKKSKEQIKDRGRKGINEERKKDEVKAKGRKAIDRKGIEVYREERDT
jgi:hypothetical protein